MPGRQYEERTTVGGLTVREDGRVVSRSDEPPRTVPGPQYAGETRAPSPMRRNPHDPVGTAAEPVTHIHEHHDYGTGSMQAPGQKLGVHIHSHTHRGDAAHHAGRGDHSHGAPSPGSPDPSMPHVPLNENNEKSAIVDGEISGIPLEGQIRAFLEGQGVDVDQALRDAGHGQERRNRSAKARMRAAGDIAYRLRQAKRKLAFEEDGWLAGLPGFSISRRNEAKQRVDQLDAELRDACVGDPAIIREMQRLSW